MVIIIRYVISDPSSNPEQSCFVTLCANTLEKGMNLFVLPLAMGE